MPPAWGVLTSYINTVQVPLLLKLILAPHFALRHNSFDGSLLSLGQIFILFEQSFYDAVPQLRCWAGPNYGACSHETKQIADFPRQVPFAGIAEPFYRVPYRVQKSRDYAV